MLGPQRALITCRIKLLASSTVLVRRTVSGPSTVCLSTFLWLRMVSDCIVGYNSPLSSQSSQDTTLQVYIWHVRPGLHGPEEFNTVIINDWYIEV